MKLEGWGGYPRHESAAVGVSAPGELSRLLREHPRLIARGNGRAYGDAAIGTVATLMARGLNRMKSFDPETGALTVESGVLLAEILEVFVPRGFFPPVVPGTKLVTVGGMVAADVHGKNHHRDGGFGAYVTAMKLMLPGGQPVSCSPTEQPDLFWATIGGMGLTGIITEVTFTMRPIETSWIMQTTTVAPNLESALKALDDTDNVTYSVAWIDCVARGASMGRSLVFAGEHASRAEVEAEADNRDLRPVAKASRLSVPVNLPSWTLNRASVAAFNEVYFRRGATTGRQPGLVHWNPYFFPLDGVDRWNRIYGKRGFLQHQCVVPGPGALAVLAEILDRFSRSGKASFLAVLKKLGAGSGLLSFPIPGYTLALDMRVTPDLFPLLAEIDKLVSGAGGRLYLAKDARQSRQSFEAGYNRLGEFKDLRRAIGADGQVESRLSKRLGI